MVEGDEAVAWEQRDGHGVADGGGGSVIAAPGRRCRKPDAVAGGGEVAGRPGLGLWLGVNASPTNAVAPEVVGPGGCGIYGCHHGCVKRHRHARPGSRWLRERPVVRDVADVRRFRWSCWRARRVPHLGVIGRESPHSLPRGDDGCALLLGCGHQSRLSRTVVRTWSVHAVASGMRCSMRASSGWR